MVKYMRKKRFNLSKKKIVYIIILTMILFVLFFLLWYQKTDKYAIVKARSYKFNINLVKDRYHDFVSAVDQAIIYEKDDDEYRAVASIHGEIELRLDPNYEIVDEYYKILDSDYYVSYQMVRKIDKLTEVREEYKYYSHYVAFNESIVLKDKAKLYVNVDSYYEVLGGIYPIIVKDNDRYGIEYNHGLVYVNKEDVSEIVEADNTSDEVANGVGVLNYHYTVSSSNENGELDECRQSICITDTMFDSHIDYLKENGYYGASIRDLELFIDGKVRLPKKSVVITIDDGWYVSRSINILEKYQMLGSLFLIGSLASPLDYQSDYLEVHSHSWNMHTLGQCPSSVGRGGILCLDEQTILDDLRKSRESLDDTTYFCYPFYDYNDRAIRLLKEAGFTMAFAGEIGDSIVRFGQNKFKIPRYVITNYTTMNDFIRYVS